MQVSGPLTISRLSGTAEPVRRPIRYAAPLGLILAALALAGCAIEMGPPPESDPPLVPKTAKAPPPPSQPTEPQAWSRDLDLKAGPTRIDREQLPEGLVAVDAGVIYSSEPLTFESALDEAAPQTAAERTLQRARERAAGAGNSVLPEVTAVPVEEVSAEALPPLGEPPTDPQEEAKASTPQGWRESRLPPPPKFPPLPTEEGGTPLETAAAQATPAAEKAPDGETVAATFAAEAWNAPAGSILVQVSAVQKEEKVVDEWKRLQARYPQILEPLRLVVEEARLGERGVFYRVQAGAFGTEEGATTACGSLIDAGQSCFVVVR